MLTYNHMMYIDVHNQITVIVLNPFWNPFASTNGSARIELHMYMTSKCQATR